ncbi:MAG: besA [Paenibacillaceae bacterium]|jgi:predicted alpha/beta superfamily hydrolase|nr:besA [Paenibacillaceae bacterium]
MEGEVNGMDGAIQELSVALEEEGPVHVPGTEAWIMEWPASSRSYRIMASVPAEEAPPEGFPVIYLLDGDSCFALAAETLRLMTRKPHGYDSAILIGIGYPAGKDASKERFRDYTTPSGESMLPKRGDGSPWPEIGGAAAFLDFITSGLKPLVAKRYPVNSRRQSLFGHSLGGFLVLHALFTRRGEFAAYVAGSPSIWWADRVLLQEEEVFRQQAEAAGVDGSAPPIELFIGIGELEKGHQSRLWENAEEMAERLTARPPACLMTTFGRFEGDGHVSVIPALIAKGIRIALSKSHDERGRII